MLYLVGISINFFLAVVLIAKKNKTRADKILAAWLLIIGLHSSLFYIGLNIDAYYYPWLVAMPNFPLLHGPMLYFYTAALTGQHPQLRRHWIWHLAPVLLNYLVDMPFLVLPYEEKLRVFESRGQGFAMALLVRRLLIYASGIVYVALSLWLLRRHCKAIADRFSFHEKINLAWLRYLIYGVGLVWVAVFWGNDQIIFSLVAVYVILLGYFGMRQTGIFLQPITTPTPTVAPIEISATTNISEPEKITKADQLPPALLAVQEKLAEVMRTQKPHLNPELTLAELAALVGVHPNTLSQVINTVEQQSYYDFINGKRIEAFKELVARPESQPYTMLALAYECGFNSKTAFYRNFKNATGQSPTDYLRQQQIRIQPD